MRFSIKWLLAATAYAAVVCASVVYVSSLWAGAIAVCWIVMFSMSVVAAFLLAGSWRAFCIGFAAFGVIASFASLSDGGMTAGVKRIAVTLTDRLAEACPVRAQSIQQFASDVLEDPTWSAPGAAGGVNEAAREFLLSDEGAALLRGYKLDGSQPIDRETAPPGLGRPVEYSVYAGVANLKAVLAYTLHQHLIVLFSLLGGLFGCWLTNQQCKIEKKAAGA